MNNPLPDCVPEDSDAAAACPATRITIDPTLEGPVCAPGGFTIEPLAVPDFSPGHLPPGNPPHAEPDPAKWDRSALPAGAYVFRVHGLRASCYPAGGRFFIEACSPDVSAFPSSFYEAHCNEAPGCSTPEKIAYASSEDGSGQTGTWWYVNDRGDTALDIVVCAPEVSSYAYGGCLALDPELSCASFGR